MTLQEHFNQIQSGKGNKTQFLKQARSLFPEYFNQYTDFNTATNILKSKQIISEAAGGIVTKGFDIYDWKKILAEEVKATEKETSKEVLDNQKNNYNNSDKKNADNINFNEIMKGFYAELKDNKNKDKTGDEIKDIVVKNLAKDCLYYTKDGMFGVKGVGYTDEAPGLGKNTQPTSKNSTILGGRDEVNSDSDIVKNSLVGYAKRNVKDTLSGSEAKTSMPKKVKEMPITPQNSSGVKKMKMPGIEKTMKLQENKYNIPTELHRYHKLLRQIVSDYGKEHELFNGVVDFIGDIDTYNEFGKRELAQAKESEMLQYLKNYEVGQQVDKNGELQSANALEKYLPYMDLNESPQFQGVSVQPNTGGSLGGRRFIPSTTVLSKTAIDALNAAGLRRSNWNKPHVKVLGKEDDIKLMISKLLLDTIGSSERGRSKLSMTASKIGTGITPVEMNQLSGEFKKLVKVLNANEKLAPQKDDYYLLDIPIKYNSKRTQYEMPLPKDIDEQIIREFINELIKEEMNDESTLPTIIGVKSLPNVILGKYDLQLTLSNGKKKLISSEELNGIYGNENPEEVVGDEWDQDDTFTESKFTHPSHINDRVNINEISPELFKRATDVSRERGQDRRTMNMGETFFNKFKGKPLMGSTIADVSYAKPQSGDYEEVIVRIEVPSSVVPSETKSRYIYYDVKKDQWGIDKEITRADARLLSLITKHINPDTRYKSGGEGFDIKGY